MSRHALRTAAPRLSWGGGLPDIYTSATLGDPSRRRQLDSAGVAPTVPKHAKHHEPARKQQPQVDLHCSTLLLLTDQ